MDRLSTNSSAPTIRRAFPVIDGYRFLQALAASAHSAVYVAHSEELGHNVAVKVLQDGKLEEPGPDRIRRFQREREMLMRIRHPSVVDIYDWGEQENSHYIVTEYFPAGSLELRIRNLMTVRDSIDMFVQIAGALVVIHRADLCHRDLKPANVMLRHDGKAVLIDFGLAISTDSHRLTSAGEVHGSPYYISPEQIDGITGDHRSDLYSLGVMFYEMLTGKRPFTGKSIVEILSAHKSIEPPALPAELAQFQPLLRGLLVKDPEQRIQTAAEALSQLAKLPV